MFGLSTFGFVHTALSLIALATGLVVVVGLVAGRRPDGWIAVYLVTAVMTDATGFVLPRDFDIVHWLGLAMAAALLVAIPARYCLAWRDAGGRPSPSQRSPAFMSWWFSPSARRSCASRR